MAIMSVDSSISSWLYYSWSVHSIPCGGAAKACQNNEQYREEVGLLHFDETVSRRRR